MRADPNKPANSAGNLLIGNFIGTNDKGTATSLTTTSGSGPAVTTVLGNVQDGVLVEGVPQLTIGMPLAGGPGPINLGGNLISGNFGSGIQIVGQGAAQITIQANFIGTDVTGTVALANSADGIFIVDTPDASESSTSSSFGPTNVLIGGNVPGTGNLISGNAGNGIENTGRGQTDDSIQGNLIGTNLAGSSSLGNAGSGVLLEGVSANTIGGTTGTTPGGKLTGVGNLISGNLANGIALATVADSLGNAIPDSNVIQGNFIGTDVTGQKPISNGTVGTSNVTGAGISIDGATNTTIGGTTAAARNLISANRGGGVAIQNASSGTVVVGNFIGTDSTGSFTDPAGNLTDADELSNDIQLGSGSTAANFGGGILIIDSPNNVIGSPSGASPGGALSGGGNLIAGVLEPGIEIEGSASRHNVVQSNYIGTNLSGTKALVTPVMNVQTSDDGIVLVDAPLNQIGGTTAAERNLISGSLESGVALLGVQSTGNVVLGNFIGSDVTGSKPISNAQAGVLIGGAVDNLIGGESSVTSGIIASGPANLISSGGTAGVLLETFTIAGSLNSPTGNQIEGNLIGTDVTGSNALSTAQQTGIEISAGAGANTIGGTTAAAGNVIAFSSGSGISLDGTTSGTSVTNTPQQVTILSNSIFSNASPGINFKRNSGLTGTLPNQGEPGPELSNFVFTDTGGLEIDGTLQSLPKTTFLLQFFATPASEQSAASLQSAILLNATPVSVTTDASGEATFSATNLTVVSGDVVYTATATDSSGNTSDYGVQAVVPPVQLPSGATVDLKLTGTARPNPVAQGGQLTYQFTVTNNGPFEATGVVFADTLPSGVTLVSSSPSQGSVNGTTSLEWAVGNLIRGQQATLTLIVTTSATGTLQDTASVTASGAQLIPGDNLVTIDATVAAAANLAVSIPNPPSGAALDGEVTYTVQVKNNGPSAATGVTLTESSLAGQGVLITATASQGTVSVTDPLSASLGSLAVGASATVTITAAPTNPGTFAPDFSATADEPDAAPQESTATLSIPVTPYSPVQLVSGSEPNLLVPAQIDTSTGLPAITPNGQYMVFVSAASDVVAGVADTGGYDNVYIEDLATGATTLVSENFAGTGTGDGASSFPSISDNGEFVAFQSAADDLVAPGLDQSGPAINIYVRNLITGTTLLASATPDGTTSLEGTASDPLISDDGQFVVFESGAPISWRARTARPARPRSSLLTSKPGRRD